MPKPCLRLSATLQKQISGGCCMANKRLVVVTGATGTLGLAVCQQLIAEGYHPVALARSREALKKLQDSHLGGITTFACDVGKASDVRRIFGQPFFKEDTLVGVIACAGILEMGDTETFKDEVWDAILRTNLSGTYYVLRASIPLLKPHGGVLIAIGSRWANGAKTAAAYSASKSGLRGMMRAMQKEFAGTNIRPVLISPGSIASRMSGSVNKTAKELNILQPHDVAKTIMHVLSSPQRVIFDEITIKAYNYDLTDEYAT
jgi:NAD(P)-dependent dehydrogenase (short-subunit alcohol dehydrogenase family)